ncbi:MAG: hypothetical protein M3220_05400 [Chloroflexota bacterium]|nr:hypothetical protein [Chloroflexota bacterium]
MTSPTNTASSHSSLRLFRFLATVQGLYYLVTGIWPLVHLRSFEAVSGPKRDDWLVKTVGVLIAVVGAVLLLAAARRRASFELSLLAAGSAAGLTGIDLVYVARGTIPPVYLLDALGEIGLLAGWALQMKSSVSGATPR